MAYGVTAHHVIFRSQEPDPKRADSETNLITLCQGPKRNGCHLYLAHGENRKTGQADRTRLLLMRKLAEKYGVTLRRALDQVPGTQEIGWWLRVGDKVYGARVDTKAGTTAEADLVSETLALRNALESVGALIAKGEVKSLLVRQ
jgi:hypothetical protein